MAGSEDHTRRHASLVAQIVVQGKPFLGHFRAEPNEFGRRRASDNRSQDDREARLVRYRTLGGRAQNHYQLNILSF